MDPRRSPGVVSVVRGAAWGVAVVLGVLSAAPAPYRFATDDAVSYLDIADAYRHGMWGTAINGYWSPLYSWVLAAATAIVRPSPASEILLVRGVNLVMLLIALAAFELVLHAAIHRRQSALPEPVALALGYAIFLWSSLVWIGVRTDTPDMTAAACIYASGALAIDRRARAPGWWRTIALGALGAAAYLAKAAMLPVGMSFVVVGAVAARRPARTLARAACGFAALAIVAAPFVLSLSRAHHRFTIGDTGLLNYAWHVFPTRRAVPNEHWQGIPAGFGFPVHPTRLVFTNPDVFEFDGPIGGTYPPWTDPAYWNEGLTLRFDGPSQARVMWTNVRVYASLLLPTIGALALFALALGGLRATALATLRESWRLWIPAVIGFAVYLVATDLVVVNIATQPSTRFVAPFVVLMFVAVLAAIRIPATAAASSARLAAVAVVTVVVLLAMSTAKLVAGTRHETPVALTIAQRLHESGISGGDRVAILGRKYDRDHDHEFWARLARVRIVSQIPNDYEALHLTPGGWKAVCSVVAATGARAIVYKPRDGHNPGGAWAPLTLGYYVYPLQPHAVGE